MEFDYLVDNINHNDRIFCFKRIDELFDEIEESNSLRTVKDKAQEIREMLPVILDHDLPSLS